MPVLLDASVMLCSLLRMVWASYPNVSNPNSTRATEEYVTAATRTPSLDTADPKPLIRPAANCCTAGTVGGAGAAHVSPAVADAEASIIKMRSARTSLHGVVVSVVVAVVVAVVVSHSSVSDPTWFARLCGPVCKSFPSMTVDHRDDSNIKTSTFWLALPTLATHRVNQVAR